MLPQKHTPGPWGFISITGEIFHADGDVDPLIATVESDEGMVDASQALADMHLIAAAPDLLEALRDLVAYCEPNSDPEVFPEEAERLKVARAAIAKAEGRADA